MSYVDHIRYQVFALEESGRLDADQAKRLRRHLKKLDHALAIKDSKRAGEHIRVILEMIFEAAVA